MNGSLLELNSIIELLKVEVEAREASFSLKTHNVENRKPWGRNRVNGGKNVTGAFLNNSNSRFNVGNARNITISPFAM